MIRKLMLGAVVAVAIGFGGQAATAHEPVRGPGGGPAGGFVPHRADYDFVVYVGHRHRDHFHWERYGRYETYHEARRVERYLEREGYRVRVEEVRDRTPDRRW
jgi:hypothetical protein